MLNMRMMGVAPALLASSKTVMLTLASLNTDTLLPLQTNWLLTIRLTPMQPILVASRAACQFIGMTLILDPTAIIAEGNMVEANRLPPVIQIRI